MCGSTPCNETHWGVDVVQKVLMEQDGAAIMDGMTHLKLV